MRSSVAWWLVLAVFTLIRQSTAVVAGAREAGAWHIGRKLLDDRQSGDDSSRVLDSGVSCTLYFWPQPSLGGIPYGYDSMVWARGLSEHCDAVSLADTSLSRAAQSLYFQCTCTGDTSCLDVGRSIQLTLYQDLGPREEHEDGDSIGSSSVTVRFSNPQQCTLNTCDWYVSDLSAVAVPGSKGGTGSAVNMSSCIQGFQVCLGAPDDQPKPLFSGGSCSDAREVVQQVNDFRALYSDTPAMRWDSNLAKAAQRWAATLASDAHHCEPSLSPYAQEGRVGELSYVFNITQRTDSPQPLLCTEGVIAWYDQGSGLFLSDQPLPFTANLPHLADVRGYAQILWRESTHVGCGLASGTTADGAGTACGVMVCKFQSPGLDGDDATWRENIPPRLP